MNPFEKILPSSSALFVAWNRYAQARSELATVSPEVAVINLVDAFLAQESVFTPDEFPSILNDLRILVRKNVIKQSVATSISNRLGLE